MGELFRNVLLLGLVLGGSMLLVSPPEKLVEALSSVGSSESTSDEGDSDPAPATSATEHVSSYTPSGDVPPNGGQPLIGMMDVFRFDMTPERIQQIWPDVSTRMSEGAMIGYRAPLCTGTQRHDLVGPLTYYFSREGHVQRIVFQGVTDDYRVLVASMQRSYGFVRRPTNSQFVMLFERPSSDPKGKATSYAWIQPAVGSTGIESKKQFELTLVLDRPMLQR